MDIWTGTTYELVDGFKKRVLDVFDHPNYRRPWVHWQSAEVAVEHAGNGRRASEGFMPLDAFARLAQREVPQ